MGVHVTEDFLAIMHHSSESISLTRGYEFMNNTGEVKWQAITGKSILLCKELDTYHNMYTGTMIDVHNYICIIIIAYV